MSVSCIVHSIVITQDEGEEQLEFSALVRFADGTSGVVEGDPH